MTGAKTTRPGLVTWLFLGLSLGLVGCDKDGPDNIYYGMVTAAEMGDYDGFLKGFTAQSRQLVQSQMSLSEAYGLRNDNPVALLVFSNVDEVKIDGERAVLAVSRGSARRNILMVKVPDEGWRIDVKQLGDFWAEERKGR